MIYNIPKADIQHRTNMFQKLVYFYFYNISAGRFRNLIANVNKFWNLKEKIFIVL